MIIMMLIIIKINFVNYTLNIKYEERIFTTMKLYFIYLYRYIQKNIKNCLFILSSITITIIMMTIITVYLDSNQKSLSIASPKLVGEHHVAFMNISDDKVTYLKTNDKVVSLQKVPYFKVGGAISGIKYASSINDTLKYWKYDLLEGTLPKDGEVLLPTSANINNLNKPKVGDYVNISLTSNKKTINVLYKISGFIRPYEFYSDYIYINDVSFHSLLSDHPELSLDNNIYLKSKNYDEAYALMVEFYTKFGNISSVILNMSAFEKPDKIDPLVIRIYILTIMIAMLICGVCLYTVISLNLNESRPNLGLLRALGAKNHQIIKIIFIQLFFIILIALPVGILIGSNIVKYIIRVFSIFNDNHIVYIYALTDFSKILIPLSSIFIIIITSIPVIVRVLMDKPLQLMDITDEKLPNFLFYESKITYPYKHPLYWYARTQIIRKKGKTTYLCITTAVCMSLFIFLSIVSSFNLRIAEQKINKPEFLLEAILDDVGKSFELSELNDMDHIEGVKYINIEANTDIRVILSEKQLNYIHNSEPLDNNQYASSVRLSTLDSFDQNRLKNYVVAGSIKKCIKNSNLIILLDNQWKNDSSKHFQLGDTIVLENNIYKVEYKIGAIVKDVPSDNNINYQFFLPLEQYNRFGKGVSATKVSIYCYPDQISSVRKVLLDQQSDNYKINDNSDENEKHIKQAYANIKLSSIICTVILFSCIIMLLCFYTYYYRSRSYEFAQLKALGASPKMITKIILYEALIQVIISSFVSISIGYILSYLSYKNVSRYPNNFTWEFPWLYMLITLFSIAFIGMISIYNSIHYISKVNIAHIDN